MDIFVTLAPVVADADGWGHMDGWGGGWMWLWGTLMMLTWALIITAAVWFVVRNRDESPSTTTSRARDILDERYAGGDITTDEYHERVSQLG